MQSYGQFFNHKRKMAKTLTVKEKILAFLNESGIKKADFFKLTGIQSSNFKGDNIKSAPGSDMLVKILTHYPQLSAEWLLTGKGDMLKNERAQTRTPQQNPLSTQHKVTEFPPITEEYLQENIETRPDIPFDAAAGGLSVALGTVIEADCERLPLIPTFPKYDFTITARGRSMEPQFMSGDKLACLFIKESSFIQWGRAHVLDTAQGVVVKRIYDNGDSILCKSNNPEFPDFEIAKDEIYHIALVVGSIHIE